MKYIVTLFFCALFLPQLALAAVKINEVAWMGTAASQYSEWIELYNDGDQDVPLAGWTIYKTGDVLLFTLSKTIKAGGYVLVERTTASAPDAVPGINDESGVFGGSGLRNSGEDLTLKDKDGNAINVLPFAGGWPAGDTKSKDTMQWTGSKWITAPGTPGRANATEDIALDSTPSNTSGQASSPQATTQTTQTPVAIVSAQPPSSSTTSSGSSQGPSGQTTTSPTQSASGVATATSENSPIAATPTVSQPAISNISPIVPAPAISAQPVTVSTTPAPSTTKKKSSRSVSSKATALAGSDLSELQDPSDLSADATVPEQQNNRTKVFIFGAVILVILALFLLLQRFKAQQE